MYVMHAHVFLSESLIRISRQLVCRANIIKIIIHYIFKTIKETSEMVYTGMEWIPSVNLVLTW